LPRFGGGFCVEALGLGLLRGTNEDFVLRFTNSDCLAQMISVPASLCRSFDFYVRMEAEIPTPDSREGSTTQHEANEYIVSTFMSYQNPASMGLGTTQAI
jgi:hypothetical protein